MRTTNPETGGRVMGQDAQSIKKRQRELTVDQLDRRVPKQVQFRGHVIPYEQLVNDLL